MRIIMGILVGEREEHAEEVQKLLTKHGCAIKTRLGLHEASNICSPSGLIILEFAPGQDEEVALLKKELEGVKDLQVRTMEF